MILIALLVIALLAIGAVRTFGGWAASVTLMEYQQAVLFRRGLPVRTFGPGHYRVFKIGRAHV